MWIKLLDEPYLNGILDFKKVETLNNKVLKLVEKGKLEFNDFCAFPDFDGTTAQISSLDVLKVVGIKKYELFNPKDLKK